MSLEKSVLANRVRVLTETLPHVGSVSIGLWVKTGSASESDSEAGISHLIEHMLFKGTERRTARQIAKEIEGIGSLNAFTDKQATCYYCTLIAEEARTGIDVLSDMVLHSKLDPDDLARERQVVIEEIRRGEDDPESHVFETFFEQRWAGHKLGLPIIGTKESVGSFEREDLARYMSHHYAGGSLLLAVAGNVAHSQVLEWAEELLSSAEPETSETSLSRPVGAAGSSYEGREIEQVHFCMGGDAPSIHDEDYHAVQLLNEILGGGMSSRLWHEVRETRGLAYSIGSFFAPYSPGGAMAVYGGTSADTWPQVQEVVKEELAKMSQDGPDEEELAFAKKSLTSSLVISLEGTGSRMRRMARQELLMGREIPVSETVEKLNKVTAGEVQEASRKHLNVDGLTTTAIGPRS